MAFRFFRRIRIAPGLTLNLSKSGISVSIGPRGAKQTVSTRGNRTTIGVPGTGLSYTVLNPSSKAPTATTLTWPSMGSLQHVSASSEERAFVDALTALGAGRDANALFLLETAAASQPQGADASWMAGMVALRLELLDDAARHFEQAVQHSHAIGQWFGKHQLTPRVSLPVTPEVTATAQPSIYSTLLALAEIAQQQGRLSQALAWLERLLDQAPGDPVTIASFAELALAARDDVRIRRAVELSVGIENDSSVHATVLYYRGLALAHLGIDHGAEAVFTHALRRTKHRRPELLREIRYQRAQVLERLGKRAQARRDLERIYAEDPGFGDVAARLS